MPKGTSLVSENTGFPYIRVADFDSHSVNTDNILFVPQAIQPRISRYTISKNDVYISIAGTIGAVGQIPEILDGGNLTENAAKIVIERIDVIPKFLMYALASTACQNQIIQATAKNAQPKLALTRIEQILVQFPSNLAEQTQIVTILSAIDDKITLHKRKKAALEALFTSLLHQLMTGKIRVGDLDLSSLSQAQTEAV